MMQALLINAGGRLLDLSRPQVMGILNVTPDSFYAASRVQEERQLAERAEQMVADGAAILDVGAFSTRPGAQEVSIDEEIGRLRWALQTVRKAVPEAVVSVDTYRPLVARMAVEEWGANLINDVSEGGQTGIVGTPIHEEGSMFQTVAALGVPYILMSVQPTIDAMVESFAHEVNQLRSLGQKDILLDPGFGFGKTVEQNYSILRNLHKLQVFGLPVMAALSRKSMLFKPLGITPEAALNATTAAHMLALTQGATLLRAHDVKQAIETIRIYRQFIMHNS